MRWGGTCSALFTRPVKKPLFFYFFLAQKIDQDNIQKTLSKNNKKEYSDFKNELASNKYLVKNIVNNTEKILEQCGNEDTN